MSTQIKDHIITNGLKNLKSFGYENVNRVNIISDEVYSAFFKSMLESNKGSGDARIERVIDELLLEIENNKK